jgi:hypothetical protein
MDSGPQSSSALDRIPVSFWSLAMQNAGVAVFSWVCYLTVSKWIDHDTLFWANSQNRSTLLHTYKIPREVNIHLVTVSSKVSRHQYLTDFLDPGSFRVKLRPEGNLGGSFSQVKHTAVQ